MTLINWTEKLSCAIQCYRCDEKMDPKDPGILSVYDHKAICMACKKEEEQRPDYEKISKNTVDTHGLTPVALKI